jgi:Tfp pilus assembly protein PilO
MDFLNFFNELKQNKQKLILAAVIAAAAVLLDISFVMKAQVSSIGSLGKKVTKLKMDIEGVKKDKVLMRKNEQQIETQENIKIYTEEEIPLLLQDISSLANDNQIDVMQISPQSREVKKQEQVKGKKEKGKAKAKPEQKTVNSISVAIKLDLACSYHNLGAFLDQLERAEQPLFAQELRISRDPSKYMKQNASITLVTYVKK